MCHICFRFIIADRTIPFFSIFLFFYLLQIFCLIPHILTTRKNQQYRQNSQHFLSHISPLFKISFFLFCYSKHNENFLHRQRIWDIMLYLG